MSKNQFLIGLFFAVFLLSQPALAQVYVPPPVNYSAAIQSSSNMINLSTNMFNMNAALASRRSAGGRGRRVGRGVAAARGGVGSFRAEAASIIPQQLAAASTNNQQEQRQLTSFFNQQLRVYENERRNVGQPTKDITNAVAYFICINFNAVHGDVVATEDDVANLTNQLNAIFATDAKIKAMSNRDKQMAYESMAILARTIVAVYEAAEAEGNQAVMNQFRQMARENLKNLLGTTADKMRFGDNGLEIN